MVHVLGYAPNNYSIIGTAPSLAGSAWIIFLYSYRESNSQS